MAFDDTLTLGSVLITVSMLISAVVVVITVRGQVTALRDIVVDLAARLTRHETSLFGLAGQVQRLIGHMEAGNVRSGRASSED